MSRVVDTLWFTNINGTLGIVVLEDDVTHDRKAYIGVVDGQDESVDTQSIIDWGNKLSLDTLKRIAHSLKREVLSAEPAEGIVTPQILREDAKREGLAQ